MNIWYKIVFNVTQILYDVLNETCFGFQNPSVNQFICTCNIPSCNTHQCKPLTAIKQAVIQFTVKTSNSVNSLGEPARSVWTADTVHSVRSAWTADTVHRVRSAWNADTVHRVRSAWTADTVHSVRSAGMLIQYTVWGVPGLLIQYTVWGVLDCWYSTQSEECLWPLIRSAFPWDSVRGFAVLQDRYCMSRHQMKWISTLTREIRILSWQCKDN